MIICGFAGIGKTTLCKKRSKWIDLESTPFEKDWDRYIKVAKHMSDQGYYVMISCHEELRKRLQRNNISYLLIVPHPDAKDEYIQRYKDRNNIESFIKNISDNWSNYITSYDWEKMCIHLGVGIYLESIANFIEMNTNDAGDAIDFKGFDEDN